jgi:hypothetical protein
MGKLKASFKCDHVLKKQMRGATCLLTISVGQESHEGERLRATVDALNDTFGRCIITLHDALQRYTMSLNYNKDPADFYAAGVKEGELWMERNAPILKNLIIDNEIVPWDGWLQHPDFKRHRGLIQLQMKENEPYRHAFETTLESYLARHIKRLPQSVVLDIDRARTICEDYLIEECAVLCLWPETKACVELYPGKHNDAVEATRQLFIHSRHPDLVQAVKIGFNARPNMRPQQFETLQHKETIAAE